MNPELHSQTTPPLQSPLPDRLSFRVLFESLLRHPQELASRLGSGHQTREILPGLIALILPTFLLFGLVVGSFSFGLQLIAAPLKILAGTLVSAVICFPSLYIFSCLSGSRIGIGPIAILLAATLALTGLLLLGFAPALWIFTQATNSFGFIGSLTLLTWLISLHFGFRFLKKAIAQFGTTHFTPLTLWTIIFTIVTLQMSTSLRPILGRSEKFLTNEKRFFIEHWIHVGDKTLKTPTTL